MEVWYLNVVCLLISCFYQQGCTMNHPHVVFILADDLGWNDVSFHGSNQIPTPNIDSLGYNGVILNRHYAQPLCTPSRAALMTGKYPIHTGTHTALYNSQKAGLPLTEKLMPEYLREMGYATHLVGKWHLGFYNKEFTPLRRGFDTHFGYWGGMISYYDHLSEDLKRIKENGSIFSGHDMRRGFDSAWDVVGEYATDLFTKEAVHIIQDHPTDTPIFLYMAHLAAHAGNQGKILEAPQEVINKFGYISNPNRRTYAAMVSKLDQSVGDVLEALRKKNMLKNSIVVFASDNGAPNLGGFRNWGSNYPFRGDKATLWEGAVRTTAIIWSPLIQEPHRVSNGLMHMTDWLPTLLAAAGYDVESLEIDGINQWQAISMNLSSSRDDIVLDIFEHSDMHGLITDSFKYIKGATPSPHSNEAKSTFLNLETIFSNKMPSYNQENIISSKAWIAVQDTTSFPNLKNKISTLRQEATVACEGSFDPLDCDNNTCLFDIIRDPCEQINIASKYPLLTAHFETVLNTYKTGLVPDVSLFLDPAADPDRFNGTWNIWIS